MRHRPTSLALAALVLAAVAGCGTSDDPPAAGGTPTQDAADSATVEPTTPGELVLPDPCALVPSSDAERLARTPLDEPRRVRDTCTYTGPVTGPTAQVEVFVGDGAKKMLDIDRELGHAFTALPGIGDEAHLEDGVAFFRKSGIWVAIRLVRLNDPAENRKPLEVAARAAAGRM